MRPKLKRRAFLCLSFRETVPLKKYYYCQNLVRPKIISLNEIMLPLSLMAKKVFPSNFLIFTEYSIIVRFEPGADKTHFCKPTAVAVAKAGQVFIADG